MIPFHGPWLLAGGWALDSFLGRQTRVHEDIDVLISRGDQFQLQESLSSWDLQVGDPPGTLRPWQKGEFLNIGIHDIWGRPKTGDAWRVQFMLYDIENAEWVYRRHPTIRGPETSMGILHKEGFRFLAPEIQLLYKSKDLRQKDQSDYEAVVPSLNVERRAWLKKSLKEAYQGSHPWVDHL